MENFHFYIVFISALIPLLIGFIWYNPNVFGKAWMAASGVNPDANNRPNMALVFGLTYTFSCLMGVVLAPIVIHQFGFFSMLANEANINDPNSESGKMVKQFMDIYGNNFRTFKHGALHGTITGIMLAMPVLAINALFEMKNAKYILINAGYWVISLALMGGVICQFM